jgi:hypothetical protein
MKTKKRKQDSSSAELFNQTLQLCDARILICRTRATPRKKKANQCTGQRTQQIWLGWYQQNWATPTSL